jgi:DNA-binding transcriptional regulator YiaG
MRAPEQATSPTTPRPTPRIVGPGELLRWRRSRGLSQTALAALLGVRLLTIHRWETALTTPPAFLRLALERLEQTR